jgi:pimeloyl-ACP methyl ester carboxylesterase
MAAFFGPSVSFRSSPKGGDFQNPPPDALKTLASATSAVLLVHGYNNDQQDASDSYSGWVQRQSELGGMNEHLVAIYWPGDNWESGAFYMQAIPRALKTGAALAALLQAAANVLGTMRVRIIAHSLGARVTMELIDHLTAKNIVIDGIAVMAAAVATARLAPGTAHPFRVALDGLPGTLLSLFSPDDNVLAFAFPLGESLAGGGFLPTALGHVQWTGSGAIQPPRLVQMRVSNAGHGDYWSGNDAKPKSVAAARQAASDVRAFLQLHPLSRGVPAAAVPERQIAPRETLAPRAVDARATPARTTASRAV